MLSLFPPDIPMTILQLHYLLTSFWLSVWIPITYIVPWYHAILWLLLALFQRIFFVAGGDVGPDPDVFWGFSALSVFIGSAVGVVFKWLVRSPRLLSTANGWEATAFIKAPVLTALFIAAQLFYAKLPPQADSPWGVILTGLLTSLIVAVTWGWSYSNPWARNNVRDTFIFFLWWIVINFVMVMFFFLGYTSLEEHFVALIAGGATLVLLVIFQFIIPWIRYGSPKWFNTPRAVIAFAPHAPMETPQPSK